MHFNQNGLTTVIMVISLYPGERRGERLGLGWTTYSVVQFVFLSNNLYFTQVNISQALKPCNLQIACIFTPLNIFTSLKTRLEVFQWLHQIIFCWGGVRGQKYKKKPKMADFCHFCSCKGGMWGQGLWPGEGQMSHAPWFFAKKKKKKINILRLILTNL